MAEGYDDFDTSGSKPLAARPGWATVEPIHVPLPTLASIRRQLDREALIPPCPGGHTPSPRLYLSWHAWADEMGRTHRTVRCGECGKWAIWVPRAGVTAQAAGRARARLARQFGLIK